MFLNESLYYHNVNLGDYWPWEMQQPISIKTRVSIFYFIGIKFLLHVNVKLVCGTNVSTIKNWFIDILGVISKYRLESWSRSCCVTPVVFAASSYVKNTFKAESSSTAESAFTVYVLDWWTRLPIGYPIAFWWENTGKHNVNLNYSIYIMKSTWWSRWDWTWSGREIIEYQ